MLIIGRPGDILQAAAGGNAVLWAGSQRKRDVDPQGVDARAAVCQQGTRTPPSCPLHFLDWHEIVSYLLCSLLFPLSVILKGNIFSLLALLSGECRPSWHASGQTGTFLLPVLSISIGKRVAKCLWMLDEMILDTGCFIQQGE